MKRHCKNRSWKIVLVLYISASLLVASGCKKFLNVNGLDALSGNDFWQTQNDVEKYTLGVYGYMRTALVSNYLNCFMGDWRAAYWEPYSGAPGGARSFITYAANNNIQVLMNPNSTYAGSNQDYWGIANMTTLAWQNLYKMVASANILYTKSDEVADPTFVASYRDKYKAEAVFLRCLGYYYLVRMFGDVPYYTNPYNTTSLPRTSQVTILQNCIKELGPVTANLPWTYSDPANNAVRAMRGGALVLMMEMNMWLAGFDNNAANKQAYYQSTDSLGNEIISQNNGAYELIPITNYPTIFAGKSKEGLIELSQNANYGEADLGFDGRSYSISNYVLHTTSLNTTTVSYSFSWANKNFMSNLYSTSDPDQRTTLWFDPQYMFNGDQNFQFYKYYDKRLGTNGNYPIGSVMIDRLADVYLLMAEAEDDLGEDDAAINNLNVIRGRAGALLYTSGGDQSVSDAIWQERCKEFMGEEKYFFDLVRTGKITSAKYCLHPIAAEDFSNGAWTWPIPTEAFNNNPYMVQTNYWK